MAVVAFSSLARILGECSTIHSLPVLLPLFFLLVESSSYTLIPLFTPGSVHSSSASWDDCGQVFPNEWADTDFKHHTNFPCSRFLSCVRHGQKSDDSWAASQSLCYKQWQIHINWNGVTKIVMKASDLKFCVRARLLPPDKHSITKCCSKKFTLTPLSFLLSSLYTENVELLLVT